MIANFFNNAKPIKSVILLIMLIVFFVLAHLNINFNFSSLEFWSLKILDILLLLSLFFIYNFIITKNKLTFTNSYALLFICLSFGLFYTALTDSKTNFAKESPLPQIILLFVIRNS